MPKIYLLGGENVYSRNAKQINMDAFEGATQPLNVLVLPWARASFDNQYQKRQILIDYFRSLGASTVNFAEYGRLETTAEQMAEAGLVYLTGGQPSILIDRLRTIGLDQLLGNYGGVIVGRSAGALALCKRCLTTCRSNSKTRIITGLDIVNITLKAHYTPQKDATLMGFSLNETIFAVPEGSALVYEDGKLYAMGNVYLFSKGTRQPFTETCL
ncbi:MAG: Type 1 glutamine amidotransferase-like domain-containing protein [Nitrososphaerota archaeon]|jgi:peptidase E|uniref:Type 1 glutamine amidotransferase-like domain-containing protein n=1 Tax=Candidatus Bathycorpusculum sp. TaxID=2994959 RepID=UPI002837076F|nr:Type 1 glutamine amidotransferase-like domain-containing protein [Candidatus Termitimicrobium sp.]MCL2431912.1 Type 1 glutamine amidotransferase-like domain-containing protein [Candidatus Termitimicrobium sp.]MDR0492767.1 Type 1 glutamine amidotransferase-like domain-containing protein [Nitrososphaerota archaeon]